MCAAAELSGARARDGEPADVCRQCNGRLITAAGSRAWRVVRARVGGQVCARLAGRVLCARASALCKRSRVKASRRGKQSGRSRLGRAKAERERVSRQPRAAAAAASPPFPQTATCSAANCLGRQQRSRHQRPDCCAALETSARRRGTPRNARTSFGGGAQIERQKLMRSIGFDTSALFMHRASRFQQAA